MTVIFKHPELTDYFAKSNIRLGMPRADIPSILKPYEGARVLSFPHMDLEIDHGFWAGLPTDHLKKLKKLSSSPEAGDFRRDALLDRRLAEADVPGGLKRRLRKEIVRLYERVLPLYEAMFSGYRFTRRQVVWRLNTIHNENLHVDTYATDHEDHFARLFINLDDQPRIWNTSWTLEEMYARFGDQLSVDTLIKSSPGEVHAALNAAAFGGRSTVWWDAQPRHVIYFDPGAVWAVDSRQVSHQIFYGRRAVSIDFFVDRASMIKPKRHYLYTAALFRKRRIRESIGKVPAR